MVHSMWSRESKCGTEESKFAKNMFILIQQLSLGSHVWSGPANVGQRKGDTFLGNRHSEGLTGNVTGNFFFSFFFRSTGPLELGQK